MKNAKFYILLGLCALSAYLGAVPARPVWHDIVQPDGTIIELRQVGDEFYHFWQNRDGQEVIQNTDGYWVVKSEQLTSAQRKARRAASPMFKEVEEMRKAPVSPMPTRMLVILVSFSDKAMNASHGQAFYDDYLNGNDHKPYGSVGEYFRTTSDGKYSPQWDVFGPVTLDSAMAYYGGNGEDGEDLRPREMAWEACLKADAMGCDFSLYDADGNGYVDNVYIIYAGYAESSCSSSWPQAVWPHSWNMYSVTGGQKLDNKFLNKYGCSAELDGCSGTSVDGIGTFCHEFSHVIGMPDYYDTKYGENHAYQRTPEEWSLMDQGSYNGNGHRPPLYSIFDKCYMKWASMPPVLAKNAQLTIEMPVGTQYARHITGTTSGKKYTSTDTIYYLENRQKSGNFDGALPGSGLLIWRVIYKSSWSSPNDEAGVLRYTVVSATGSTDYIGKASDPFPGSNKVTSKTLWPGCALTGITSSNNVITFNYNGGSTQYNHIWMANGSQFTTTTSRSSLSLPTSSPSACSANKQFYGWTKQTIIQQDGSDLVLAKAYDEISTNTTFYAVYKTTASPARYSFQCNDQTYKTNPNAKAVIVEGQEIEIGGQVVNTPGVYPYDTIKTIHGDSLLAVNLTWADLNKTIVYTAPAQLAEVTGTTKSYGLHTDKFGQQIMEHYFSNGIGVIAFDKNLTTIGQYAFYGSRAGLESSVVTIQLPNTVTTIGTHAFDNCWELTTLNLPSGVTSVGDNAFYKCYALTNLRSEALTPPTCGSNCFYDATSKIVLYVWPSALSTYKKTTGWKDLTNIRRIYCGTTPQLEADTQAICQGETYTWREKQLTKTGNYADSIYTDIYGCDSVIYRLNLTVNPKYLFKETATLVTGMTYTWRERDLTTTGIYYDSLQTMAGCDSVYQLTLNFTDSTRAIIYQSDKKLKEYTHVVCKDSIGLHAYKFNQPVVSHTFDIATKTGVIAFANPLTAIGDSAFYGCRDGAGKMTSVILPKTVTAIGNLAFYCCWNMTSLNIPASVDTIGNAALARCEKLPVITLPEGIRYLKYRVMDQCKAITSLTIPASVKVLEKKAIATCTSLTSITCKALTPPTTYTESFDGLTKSTITLYVYPISENAYRAADNWKDFFIQTIPCEGEAAADTVQAAIRQGDTYTWRGKDLTQAGCYADTLRSIYGCDSAIHCLELSMVTDLNSITYYAPNQLTEVTDNAAAGLHINAFGQKMIYHNFANGKGTIAFANKVTQIGDFAFYGSEVATLVLSTSAIALGNNAFGNCDDLETVYVPLADLTDYQSAVNWSAHKDIIYPDAYLRTSLTESYWGTLCLPNAVKDLTGLEVFEVLGWDQTQGVALGEVTELAAGKPYVFIATSTTFAVKYDLSVTRAKDTIPYNGTIGSYTGCVVPQGMYLIVDNLLYKAKDNSNSIDANRAYFDVEHMPAYIPQTGVQRRVVFIGKTTPTEIIDSPSDTNPVKKIMVNGRLMIICNGKMFNSQGIRL